MTGTVRIATVSGNTPHRVVRSKHPMNLLTPAIITFMTTIAGAALPASAHDTDIGQARTGGAVMCSASSDDSAGATANEKTFRGVIRRLWEKEARPGSDGAVTIAFQKVVVGAPRAFQPTASDAYSQADPSKPIYPVSATFSTCTDFKTAISRRAMERIYNCFVHKTGGWQCTQTGASGALAVKDKSEYIPKK